MPKGVYQHGKGHWLGKKRPPFSEDWKKRIGEATKRRKSGVLGKHWSLSEETKLKMSRSQTGKRLSEEHRRKIGLASIGRKHTEEWKKIRSEETRGEKSPSWQGGKSFEIYSVNWTKTLKRSIRERDKYTCQECEKEQGDIAFCVHHIDYDKKNCDPKNLITLCIPCHIKTNYNKDYWIKHFNNKGAKLNGK